MSELNVYHHELRPGEYAEFYLKYEADKVIKTKDAILADMNAELVRRSYVIADLEESHKKEVEQLLILNREQANAANRLCDSMEQTIRHQKYKRCLDKAKWCKLWYEQEKYECELKDVHHWFRMSLYDKWHKRWLELADKFKEAK